MLGASGEGGVAPASVVRLGCPVVLRLASVLSAGLLRLASACACATCCCLLLPVLIGVDLVHVVRDCRSDHGGAPVGESRRSFAVPRGWS